MKTDTLAWIGFRSAIFAFLALFASPFAQAQEMEPGNNTYTGAENLGIGRVIDYQTSQADSDWFLISKMDCYTLKIRISHSSVPTNIIGITVYSGEMADLPPLEMVDFAQTNENLTAVVTYTVPHDQNVLIEVAGVDVTGTINYSMDIQQISINKPIKIELGELGRERAKLRRTLKRLPPEKRAEIRKLKKKTRKLTARIKQLRKKLCVPLEK